MNNTTPVKKYPTRGFASMDKERQRAIASQGGKVAHARGFAHQFSSAEGAAAARVGHARGKAHEFTPEEARLAGRKGGLARARNRLAAKMAAAATGIATGIATAVSA